MIINSLCNISTIGFVGFSGGFTWMRIKNLYLMQKNIRPPLFNNFYQLINPGFVIGIGSSLAYIILQKPILEYLIYE